MGFLYQVLKDVSEKQPYKVGRDILETLLRDLKTKLSTGREGFKVIAQVAERVREYNRDVEQRSKEIKDKITQLDDEMKTTLKSVNETYPTKNDNDDEPNADKINASQSKVTEMVKKCQLLAKTFKTVLFNLKGKIKDLGHEANEQITKARDNVEREGQRLGRVQKNEKEQYEEMEKRITSVLLAVKEKLNQEIRSQVNGLISLLNEKVKNILKECRHICRTLENYLLDLDKWMETAKTYIDDVMEKQVGAIKKEVDGDSANKNKNKLDESIETLGSQLDNKVQQLTKWKNAGAEAVRMAKRQVAAIGEMVVTENGTGDKIHGLASDMKTKAEALRKAAKDVKEQIGGWVKAALQQVKEMNDALKKDLFTVKGKIKEAIWDHVKKNIKTPYDELEGNMKEGLWTIEDAITKDLKVIVGSAQGLNTKIRATKEAIEDAIRNVKGDLDKVINLEQVVNINGKSGKVKAPLLQHIASKDAFTDIKNYFSKIDNQVMQPVQTAMTEIAEAMKNIYASPTFKYPSVGLQAIVIPDIATVTIGDHPVDNVEKLDLGKYTQDISKVLQEANTMATITTTDAQSLLKSITEIAKAVATHSEKVVIAVMDKIKSQLTTDIGGVAKAIHDKVNKLSTDVNKDDDQDVEYSGRSKHDNARGLKWLVDQFDSSINRPLVEYQSTVDEKFKKKQPGGRDPKDYDLGKGVMNAFKNAYDALGGKLEQGTFQKAVADKLTAEIGGDGMIEGSGAGGKIADLSKDKYANYTKQVDQDTLALLNTTPDKVEGHLPNAIRKIGTDVTSKLTKDDTLNGDIDGNDTFTSPFSQITDQLNEIAGLVDSEKQTPKPSNGKTGVTNYLTDIEQMLQGVTYSLTSDVKSKHPSVQGLEKIKNDIGLLQSENIENVKHNLNELCAAVRWAANEVNWFLREMKEGQIDEKLVGIRKQIHDLRIKEIQGTITLCTDFLQKATESGQVTIKALEKHVDEQVADAIKTITTQAQKHYVCTLKIELQHFTARVQGHLTGLTTLIDKDLVQGYKGLMKTVQGVKFIVEHKKEAEFDKSADTTLLTKLNDALALPPGQETPTKENLKALVDAFEHYFNNIHGYVKNEIKRLNEQHEQTLSYKPSHAESEYNKKVNASRLDGVHNELTKVIYQLKVGMRYDRYLPGLLDGLREALDGLRPECYALPSTPLLDCIGSGLRGLVGELRFAYISSYDCAAYDFNWDVDGRKCAKVFLTSLATLSNDFKHLPEYCKEARFNQIHATHDKYNNKLGDLFSSCGYKVSMYRESHEGELRNKPNFTGTDIHAMIHKNIFKVSSIDHLKQWMTKKNKASDVASTDADNMSLLDILQFLYECLEDYYSVSHLRHIERPKSPSSVYQMLVWLTGLSHNRVNSTVSVGDIGQLFEKADEDSGDGNNENPPVLDKDPDTLPAYPQTIAASNLSTTLRDVCVHAEDVLIGILGHGHADGIYAVDFNTNPDGFSYPTAPGACFDMLADILCRLYQQLYFLYTQCSNDESSAGWRNCSYGRYVGGSNWKCNDFQCDNQECNQKCKQTCNQIHEQTGDQHPKCGIKSPLQSFLEDGLPGFLPHSFTKPGCKLECTYSNHRGIPCRTPMGFSDISVMASHTQTGTHLTKILRRFCGQRSSLRSLCSNLVCLLQKPPQTLGDMFSFYYNYIYGWNLGGIRHKETAFKAAVKDANFGVADDEFNIHSLFSSSHSSVSIAHSNGSLGGLVCTSSGYAVCGSYLHPITNNIGDVFSEAYADRYLSWIVYLTETFYDLLKKLYDDCTSKCGSKGYNCHVKACIKDCSTKSSKHLSPAHDDKCKSIIECKQALPTLYKYGFVFMFQTTLNGNPKISTKRTCSDFCKTLETVLSDKKSEEPILTKLIYVTIPNFLWKIRSKFFWTTVALWSLSLFYLICVMVGRLDVLHIRSHLRTPSSHRITAQTLLAAAQVGRLAKISYLQP